MIVFCTYDIKNSPIYTNYTHPKLNISDPKEYFQFRSLSHNPFFPFLFIYSPLKNISKTLTTKTDRQRGFLDKFSPEKGMKRMHK